MGTKSNTSRRRSSAAFLCKFLRCQRHGQNPRKQQMSEEVDCYEDYYEPPCRQLLRERHLCEKCGKRLTLHTLLYRHICDPMAARRERAVQLVREAAQELSSAASTPPPTSCSVNPQILASQPARTAPVVNRSPPASCSVKPQILARVGGFGSNISRTNKCR